MSKEIVELLKEQLQTSSLQFKSVDGGCINDCFKITAGEKIYFLKLNSATQYPGLFEKEKMGLEFLQQQNTIRVPGVILFNITNQTQVLLMEWIETGIKTETFWKDFGEQLAKLHQQTWSDRDGQTRFGSHEDNYIGSLPQSNSPEPGWIKFFIRFRILPQMELAEQKNLVTSGLQKKFEKLFENLPAIFQPEESSLLHGDLWSGNFICDENSQPVLIDPAVYFGHRNMDLAMTTLFGGFDKIFYEAYHYHFPLPSNYKEQWEVCNLYPLLVHLNLFGSGYLSQIETILKKYN